MTARGLVNGRGPLAGGIGPKVRRFDGHIAILSIIIHIYMARKSR